MPGLFIDVKVAADAAKDPAIARKLAEACPVDIFEATDAGVSIVEANLDECTLCDLCLEAAPGKVEIVKLYEREGP
jgi:NAD-dependent dihydropyrimidine dehydrogenase PreA subunit